MAQVKGQLGVVVRGRLEPKVKDKVRMDSCS